MNEAAKPPVAQRATGRIGTLWQLLIVMLWMLAPLQARCVAAASTNQPTGTARADVRLEIDRYEVSGNTLLSKARMIEILAPYFGKAVGLETVKKALAALQTEYRDRGYITVAVTLPPQKVTNGVLRSQVTEGKLVEVKVVNNKYYSSNNIMKAIPGLQTDRMLNSKLFAAELDRANQNPDRQIYPEVRPGPEPGTSAMVLDVKDRMPLHGRAEVNNASAPGTPDLRVNVNASYDNLWQREHSIGLQYGMTPEMKQSIEEPGLPLALVDSPMIANYSMFYRAPLGGFGPIETPTGPDVSRFGYNEATHQFVLPPPSGRPELTVYSSRSTSSDDPKIGDITRVTPPIEDMNTHGFIIDQQASSRAFTVDLAVGSRLRLPAPTALGIQSTFSVGLDYKEHTMVNDSTNVFFTETILYQDGGMGPGGVAFPPIPYQTNHDQIPIASSSRSYVSYIPVFVGWDGARKDKWGQFSGGVSATANIIQADNANSFRHVVGTTNADGKFVALRMNLSRDQRLIRDWTLLVAASGQWANQPLVTTEQFGIGGNSSVRGYQEGERYGDTGWATQLEVKSPTAWLSPKELSVGFSAFTDYGQSYSLNPSSTEKTQNLWGTGVGMNLFFLGHLQGRVAVAWPLLDSSWRKAYEQRVTFSVSGQF